jgi:ribose transport system ATP-binding protein
MKHELFRMDNVTIKEGGIIILDNIYVNLFKCEILGIFVYDSVEKKHLIDLIFGSVEIESGRIYYNNIQVNYGNYADIARRKIVLIQSSSKLIDNLTVADNIFVVCQKHSNYMINNKVFIEQAQALFKKLGLDINPKKSAHALTSFEKISVEISKAFVQGTEIIILKDLSGYLSDSELSQLIKIVKNLKKNGISLIMIDSFANVLKQFADRVFVMKNGRNVWTFKNDQFEQFNDDVLGHYFYRPQNAVSGSMCKKQNIVLKFENVSTSKLEPLSFEIRSGEILSIIDREGLCIDEINKILNGENTKFSGQIFVEGKTFKTRRQWESIKKGLAFIVENPTEIMLFKDKPVIDNLCFAAMGKINNSWLNAKYQKCCFEDYKAFFTENTMYSCAGTLSLYDQQKLIYLKWHLYNPKVVVCLRPFSSIEAELRKITYEMVEMLLKKGIAVLVLGSNYTELNNSDTKIIFTSNKVVTDEPTTSVQINY